MTARAAVDGAVCGLGGLPPRRQEDRGNHGDQAGQPAQDERQSLPGALLGAQDQDEGYEREWFEGDPEPDEHQVKYHAAPRARVGRTSQVGLGGDPSRCDGGDE